MKEMFDHTTCVAADDPEIKLFKYLDEARLIDLRILEDGVGCEKFAELVAKYLQKIVSAETDGRANVYKVQCWEHEDNMAEYYV